MRRPHARQRLDEVRCTISARIARPRAAVLALLAAPEHRSRWLRDLVVHEPVYGADGEVGVVSRVVFGTGRRAFECTETVTRREPAPGAEVTAETPVRYTREIRAEGMWSEAHEELSEAGPDATVWKSVNVYRFRGPMRWIAPLLRRSLVAQQRRVMLDFRAFAEQGVDVRD